jgi:hypothetical protein
VDLMAHGRTADELGANLTSLTMSLFPVVMIRRLCRRPVELAKAKACHDDQLAWKSVKGADLQLVCQKLLLKHPYDLLLTSMINTWQSPNWFPSKNL